MSANSSSSWTPTYGSATFSTFTPTDAQTSLSPSRYSYTTRSDHEEPEPIMRRYDNDSYTDDDSLSEVERTLTHLDDEITHTEDTLNQWSQGSYTGSYTGSANFTGTYTGSSSYMTLPTIRGSQPPDPRIRLSRITERTEDSRPTSGTFSTSTSRPINSTPDSLNRSALFPGDTQSGLSRSPADPNGDRTLPPPGRTAGLIAQFESQSGNYSRFPSTPGQSTSPSPMTSSTTTGYIYESPSYGSRPSSPSKYSVSFTNMETRPTYSSLLSPPVRSIASDYTRTTLSDTLTRTSTNTQTGTDTVTGVNSSTLTTPSYTDTGSIFAPASNTTLRRLQPTPRSPLASVRNLVSAWKEKAPASRSGEDKLSDMNSNSLYTDKEGLHGIRRRVQRAGARLRESGGLRPPSDTIIPGYNINSNINSNDASLSYMSNPSEALPLGFDLRQFSPYTQSTEAPLYIGLLWYLNVHAAPPYRWQRCQALLYPRMLLLSWIAPGGGRGIVALDLLNCTGVQSAPSPTHPSARDDIGTVAASFQSAEKDGQPLMDMLVPFHMMYADGVERLAAESLRERQKWVNRVQEAVRRPVSLTDSQLTRSPTISIRTIDSHASSTSVGSRLTVFVPPLNSLPDIADYRSESSPLSRHLSFASSHHSGTVDDTVIRNDGYIYPGDRRVITPSRGNSLRRSGSMTDIDLEFNASSRARGKRPTSGNVREMFEYSPASMSSAPFLGRSAYITPPTSNASRPYLMTDGAFLSVTSSAARSNVSSTYLSGTERTGVGSSMGVGTGTGTVASTGHDDSPGLRLDSLSTLTTEHGPLLSQNDVETSYSSDSIPLSGTSASTLFRARAVTRRVRGNSRSGTSTYTLESSDKENMQPSPSYAPSDSVTHAYTPGSSTLTSDTGSRTITSGSYTPGSETYSDTFTPGSSSYTGTYTPTTQSGSYTPGSRTENSTTNESGMESYTNSVTASGSGSYTMSGSDSYTSGYTPVGETVSVSRSYTPGSLSHGSASYTGTYTPVATSQSASNSFTRGTETGYDICPSSDLTTLTQASSSIYSETLTPPARYLVSPRPHIRDSLAVPARRRTTSQTSSEYLTAEELVSGPSSPASFKSLSTIPSLPETEFITADGSSTTYKTASEPPTLSEYYTASQMYTPSHPPSDPGLPQEIELVEGQQPEPIFVPERGMRREIKREVEPALEPELRPQSGEFELEYKKYESVITPAAEPEIHQGMRSGASTPKPLSSVGIFASEGSIFHPISALPRPPPSEIPTIPSPRPSFTNLSEIPLPPTESISSLSPLPTTTESVHVPTPSTIHQSLPASSRPGSGSEPELSSSLPETKSLLESESVSIPPSFEGSSAAYVHSRSLPPTPRVVSEPTLSTPSLPDSLSPFSSSEDVPIPSSLPISTVSLQSSSSIQSTPWARETSLSYDSSILHPSPSFRSLVVHDIPEASYDTSQLRPSASSISSLSSDDKLSTIPPSISPLTSLAPRSPLASITPLSSLSASASSALTPSSLSISSEPASITRSPVLPQAIPITPVVARSLLTVSSSYMTESETETSMLDYSSSLADTIEEELEGPEPEVELSPVLRNEGDEDRLSTISTEPSLLSTVVSSEHIRSRSATPMASAFPRELSYAPSPVQAPSVDIQRLSSLTTPEDSGSVSEHTPTATSVSAPGTLLTESSPSIGPSRDIGRDLDRLADDLRRYHDARGEEAQGLANNLRVLRDELRDLSDFLHRPSSPIIIQQSVPGSSRIIGRHARGPRVLQRVFENIHDDVPVPTLALPSPPQITEQYKHQPQVSERPVIFERIHDDIPAPTSHLAPPFVPHLVVSRAIGSNDAMTEEYITMEGHIRDSGVTVTRSNSNASSMSFLSSHHSDDSLLEGSVYEPSDIDWESVEPMSIVPEERPRNIPMLPDDSESFEDESEITTSSFTSSLETTSLETSASTPTPETTTSLTPTPERSTATPSPVNPVAPVILMHPPSIATTSSLSTPVATRMAPLPTPPPPAVPSLDDLMDSLRGQLNNILHQLTDLQNGQGSTNRMIDILRSRPEPQPVDNSELHDRLNRIEDLIRNLADQGRRQEPIVIPIPEPTLPHPESEHPESSILTTSDSLSDLRIQLESFPSSRPPLRMPVPSQAMPSILDQLMGSISSLPPVAANRPPPLQPFVFEPRSIRPRSTSPMSMDTLPSRPFTVSIPDITFYDPRGTGPSATRRTHTQPRGEMAARFPEMTASDYLQNLPSGHIPPFAIPQEHLREVDQIWRRPGPRRIFPTPQPVFPPPRDSGAATAPPGPSWYLPRQRPRLPPSQQQRPPQSSQTLPRRDSMADPRHDERRAGSIQPTSLPTTQPDSAPVPAPAEQLYIPMPPGPIQIPMPPEFDAMMEVLRENRLAQVATVDQQRELMRYMADLNNWLSRDVQDRQAEIRGVNARIENLRREVNNLATGRGMGHYSPTVTSSSEGQVTVPGQGMPMSMPEPQHYPPGPFISQHQSHPPVIPPDVTPSPSFPPVIPPVIPGTHPGVVPTGAHTPGPWGQQAPVIPMDQIHMTPGPSSHHSTPLQRSTTPEQPFIPPDVLESETEPRIIPPPTGSRINLIAPGRSPSPSSSRTDSTQASHSPRRSATHLSGRTSLQSPRSYLRDRSGSVSYSSSGSSRSPSRTPRGSRSGYGSGRSRTETPGTRLSRSESPEHELHGLQPAGPLRSAPEIEVIPVPPQHLPTAADVPRSAQQQQQPLPQTIVIGQPGIQQPMDPGIMPTTPTAARVPSVPTENLYIPPGHPPPPIIIQTSPSRSRSDRSYQSSRTPSLGTHRSRSQTESPLSRHSSGRYPEEERDESPTRMPPSQSPGSRRSRYSGSPSRHYYTPTTPVPPQHMIVRPSESQSRSSRSFSPSHYEPGVPSEHEVLSSHPLSPTIIQMPPQHPPAPLLVHESSRSPSSRSLSIGRPRTESRRSRHSPSRGSVHSRPRSPTPIPIMIPSTAPTSAPPPQIVIPSTGIDYSPPQLQLPTISRSGPRSRSRTPSHSPSRAHSSPPRTPITVAPSRGRRRSGSSSRRRLRSHSPPIRPIISGEYHPRHTRSRSYSPTSLADRRVLRYPSSRPGHSPRHHQPLGHSPSHLFYPSEYSSHHRSSSRAPVRGRDRSRSRTPTVRGRSSSRSPHRRHHGRSSERQRQYSRTPPQEHYDRRPRRRSPTSYRERDGGDRQRSYTPPRERDDDRRRRSRTLPRERDDDRRRRSRTPPHERDGDYRRRSRTPPRERDDDYRRRPRSHTPERDDDHRRRPRSHTPERDDDHRRRPRTPLREHDDDRRRGPQAPIPERDDDHRRRPRSPPHEHDDDYHRRSHSLHLERDDDHSQQYSRTPIDDHGERRTPEYSRYEYPSVSRYPSSRSHVLPSLGPPDSPSGVHLPKQLSHPHSRHELSRTPASSLIHGRSESPLRVPAPETRHVDYPEPRPSRSESPITVAPPSPTVSRASRLSHRAPTIVAIEPEDIVTHDPRRIPRSRTPTTRHPSGPAYYSPVHSLYEADDGRPHSPTDEAPSRPAIPIASTPSQTPTVQTYIPPPHVRSSAELPAHDTRSSLTRSPEISSPPATRSPPAQALRQERSGSPVYISRRPSEQRSTFEGQPIEQVEHEVSTGVPPVAESDVGYSDYDYPLPVPPRRLASTIHPPPRSHRSATPIEFQDVEHERERHERLGAIERHLHDVALAATQAEDEREAEFRRNEEHREKIFLENQERREHENRERTEHLWDTLQSRLEALPPARPLHELSDRPSSTRSPSIRPQTPRTPTFEDISEAPTELQPGTPRLSAELETKSIASSMRSVVEGVASRHAEDILETVRLEREEFAREREAATTERERLMNEAEETRRQFQEEQAVRIRALEEELAVVKADLQGEKQARMAEEADIRERERAESLERDELLRAQLNDITNLLQDNRDITAQKKIDSDDRYAEKAARRQNKDLESLELREMIGKIHDDLQAEIQQATDERIQNQSKPALESIIEQLQRQNAEQQELLRQLSEDWRNDCERHHKETLEAVKSTAQEQVPFNVQGYLDEFSKALAAEVRMLLGEVGKLREERRNLQHEMGFLLCMKSKYGPGGEFQPDWQPPAAVAPVSQEPPPPPADTDLPAPAAKPGWRQIGKRKGKKKDRTAAHAPPLAALPHVQPHNMMDPRRQVTQSWATWLPDPDQAPTPPSIEPSLTVPRATSPGLFGPRTPSNKSWAE